MSVDLESLRTALDQIDDDLVEALAKRQLVIDQVAAQKLAEGSAPHDPRREREILVRLAKAGRSRNLDTYYLQRVFREILDHSTRRQEAGSDGDRNDAAIDRSLRVGHLGIEGSYSQLAAAKHFGPSEVPVTFQSCPSFQAAMLGVADGVLAHAVIPIENTTAGSINACYDLMAKMDLAIVGEVALEINHCLLAHADVPLHQLQRVYSHPQALDQCMNFLRALPSCHLESVSDTATAARMLKENPNPTEAAIASADAAAIYGLHIVKRDVADQPQNFTRFVVVGREPRSIDLRIPGKTSLMFAAAHERGALLRCLSVLHDHDINLTKLQSRPRPNAPWEYLFYVDIEGHVEDPRISEALKHLAAATSYMKVFGSYPQRIPQRLAKPEPSDGPKTPSMIPAARNGKATLQAQGEDQGKKKLPYKLVTRLHRPDDTIIRVGQVDIGGDRPVVIAGPCSVESRDQIMHCAEIVKDHGGDLLRGGCFKPRTSPYSFQGLGHEGLKLLRQAGQHFDIPVVTEVLDSADVSAVAEHADVLQIGARNMQNYALLNEVGKVDRPVLLKRGMMATIEEWLAAAEYILLQGNRQVILCERGIRTFETSTRHTLDISAIPVIQERTHLPIVVDPSHAAGNRDWVAPLAAASLSAGAHGIMVEIHPNPSDALCDGPQALTAAGFSEMMQRIRC